MLHANPFLPNKDENGNYHYAIPWEIREANPIGQMYYANGQNISKSHALQGNIFLTIQPITGLKLKSNFGYTFYADNSRNFTPVSGVKSSSNKPPHSHVGCIVVTGVCLPHFVQMNSIRNLRQKSCFSSVFVRFPPSPNGIQVAVKRRFGQI